jgi:hypothetical protein
VVTETGTPPVVPVRLRVTPGMAEDTVLVVLEMGIPSTLSEAFAPVTPVLKPTTPEEGVMVRLPDAPLVLLISARRAPLASR